MLLGKTIVVTGISSGIGSRIGELATAFGADVIGVDVKHPTEAARSLRPGRCRLVLRALRKSLTRCRRGSTRCATSRACPGVLGASKTLAMNFYGLRSLTEALAHGFARAAPWSTSPPSRATGGAQTSSALKPSSRPTGFPDLATLLAAHQVPDGEAYPLSKELLLLWTMQAAHQPLFKAPRDCA